MGLFDTVEVACPHCGATVDLQCDGDEQMARYTVKTAPTRILLQVMGGTPTHCGSCDGWLILTDPRRPAQEVERPPTAVLKVSAPTNPICHSQGMKWWPDGEPFGPEKLIK